MKAKKPVTVMDHVVARHKTDLKDARAKLQNIRDQLPIKKIIARAMDECLYGRKSDYIWTGWSFEVKFFTISEAREFTDLLLDKLEMSKAEKEFDGYGDKPLWLYVINFQGEIIKVSPAEADEQCKPVRHLNLPSSYWACEREG